MAPMNWNDIWQRTVGAYSRRRFTDSTDKLQAIAGLADSFERKVGSRYLAGLWMNNLVQDLLWMTISPLIPNFELDQRQYIAPSWSWASSSKPIEYIRAKMTGPSQWITILESNVQRTGSNEKGKLAGGYLKVRCLAKVLSGTSRKRRATEQNTGYFLPKQYRPQLYIGEPLVRIYDAGDEWNETWVYWDKETDLYIEQDTLICLVNTESRWHGHLIGAGLALRKADVAGHYKRVGMAVNISMSWIKSAKPLEITIV